MAKVDELVVKAMTAAAGATVGSEVVKEVMAAPSMLVEGGCSELE